MDDDEAGQLFGVAPGRGRTDSLAAIHAERPGFLYAEGLSQVQKHMGSRSGANGEKEVPKLLPYLLQIVVPSVGFDKMGQRTMDEMRTLAESLDSLAQGELDSQGMPVLSTAKAEVADRLMQRFKALECYLQEGSWTSAGALQLLPRKAFGLASDREVDSAMRRAVADARYDRASKDLKRQKV